MGGVTGLACLQWVALLGVIPSLVVVLEGLLEERRIQQLLISNTRIIEIGIIPKYAAPPHPPPPKKVNEKTGYMLLGSHWEPQH